MKILTGNDLKTGAVTWWTGEGWSLHVAEAVDVGDQGDAIAARENAARRVVSPYVIDGETAADGPRPAHIKERIRALGPTVRLDLSLKPADPAAGNWVI
ncbi:DUF2849 domain-containing protein [Novosphingobium piscinae]|uniref:DUF2849 domain-containing protein n=1 Tax=Novosphingobium piscinae TaxID=1507448 RepID=A0A7X1FWH2_9SPHN|nr:DUF2849 domain-containing protein [Novosphingobium piscinae]MBC2668254.1 DUF2849 domain-containing protein [Novosphingobium piscinae]